MQSGGGGGGSADAAAAARAGSRRSGAAARAAHARAAEAEPRRRGAAAPGSGQRDAAGGRERPRTAARRPRAALDKLQRGAAQARSRIRTGRGERDVQDALRRAEELAAEQQQVQSEVGGLAGQADASRQSADAGARRAQEGDGHEGRRPAGAARADRRTRLAAATATAARKLDEAAGSITDKRIREKIRYTQNAMQAAMSGQSDYMRTVGQIEEQLSADLDTLRQQLGRCAVGIRPGSEGRRARPRAGSDA